ncbi:MULTISPECIES: hypothetical protein [Flavobacterium]|uniref:Uncharacterized protein n=1 Tax=Flavobacterium jumunjinense TaxID=998845 RepID=A0ABV5GTA1_9FLAO|nr:MULTISPECIES: hypothetical protein [Flavobacterium]
MNKPFWYLFCLLICTVFVSENNTDTHVIATSTDADSNYYSSFLQSSNKDAIQVQSENYFTEHSDFESGLSFKKLASKFTTTLSFQRDTYFSSLICLNRKRQNNVSIFFSTTQIIFPFHNFW